MLDQWIVTRPRSIVAASNLQDTAVEHACRWQQTWGADLTVVHAVADAARMTRGDSDAWSARLAADLELRIRGTGGAERRVKVEVERGEPDVCAVRVAEDLGADLVVVDPDGGPAAAESVAELAHCPVFVARPSPVDGPIVAAWDLSAAGQPAMAMAVAFAARLRAPLVIVHGLASDSDTERREARAAIDAAVARLDATAQVRLSQGPAAHALRLAARELDARLVVVGARGAGRMPRRPLGSVARELVRWAPCSVLVARAVRGVAP